MGTSKLQKKKINDKRVSYYTACEHTAGRNTKKPDPVKVKMFQTGCTGIFRTLLKRSANTVNSWKPLAISTKCAILYVCKVLN